MREEARRDRRSKEVSDADKTPYVLRKANLRDVPALEALIARSARELGAEHYTAEEIEGALRGTFGVDTQLIRDETYFVAEHDGHIVGCGGWSYRTTLFGSDKLGDRDTKPLDPKAQPARIRAFFVDPAHARKGIGRMLLAKCELEAYLAHFRTLELMASLSSMQLYAARGYVSEEPQEFDIGSGLTIRLVPMRKRLLSRDESSE